MAARSETAPSRSRPRVGVLGARGITGAEVLRLLWEHPGVDIAYACSEGGAGQTLDTFDPAAPPIPLRATDDVDLSDADVALLCLPHGRSAPTVERCVEAGLRVVDLSGDFRLADAATHERTYGTERSTALAEERVYGLTEWARESLRDARVVANPGCYPTSVAVALAPLARAGVLTGTVIVNSTSGVSGAGRKANETTHFCSAYADVKPYKVGRAHRHVAEMEEVLTGLAREAGASEDFRILFNPHLVPLERGILSTCVVETDGSTEDLRRLYEEAYGDEGFVVLLPEGRSARVRAAAGTNRAVVSLHPVEGSDHVVVCAAIDNVIKGAAGQAIQNMNRMLGLDEGLGLPGSWKERHP